MKLAIIGYGKMGRILEGIALDRGHRVTAVVDPFFSGAAPVSGASLNGSIAESKALDEADVALEFTRPETAAANIRALLERGVPTVTGTTGWHDSLEEITALTAAKKGSLCWSSNYSLGVNLFYRIAAFTAKLADPFPEYDVGGWEFHHNKKVDSPSGTAKILTEKVLAAMTRKKKAVYQTLESRPPAADELHFPSLRLGSMPGLHALAFDSPADTIEITHTARSRDGLALGAIRAAEWLVNAAPGKPAGTARMGVFTIDDVMEDILKDLG
ncbi:MAG: 4-hydroxy-tetrahydrodipicolinate reductase [Treponema sp.]|jgi:4-hydroxy-tetrahydrodipicolinate reductase|nr:4-hydroxy-tetrahydrodipicolinate reductase [Treponema sp.]